MSQHGFLHIPGDTNCELNGNLQFDIIGVGDEAGEGPFYTRTGCTEDVNTPPIQISGCVDTIPNVEESDSFNLIFTDAANCEQKITFDGLQYVIVEPLQLPGMTGFTGFPITEYKPTYNYGIEWGTFVYNVLNTSYIPATYQELQTAITNRDIVEILVEDVVTGSTLLSMQLKSYDQMTAQDFQNVLTNGYQFAF